MAKLIEKGYGQLEINNGTFRRDGRIEAQCDLDTTDFNDTDKRGENGMLVVIDKANKKLKKATADLAAELPVAILYSAEHNQDERKPGLKNFSLGVSDVRPRAGILTVGDKFTSNTFVYNSATYSTPEDFLDACVASESPLKYVGFDAAGTGYWAATATAPTVGPVGIVSGVTTMPDGQAALSFEIVKVL